MCTCEYGLRNKPLQPLQPKIPHMHNSYFCKWINNVWWNWLPQQEYKSANSVVYVSDCKCYSGLYAHNRMVISLWQRSDTFQFNLKLEFLYMQLCISLEFMLIFPAACLSMDLHWFIGPIVISMEKFVSVWMI